MKLNWGTGITIVYSLFALSMVAAVVQSRKHDPGLVQKDYYNLDLNYQDHLEKKQNTARLPEAVKVQYQATEQSIYVQFPANAGVPSGSVKCYRAATVKDDVTRPINVRADGQMVIPAAGMTKGLWHLDIDWQANGVKYFQELTLTVG